jgi:hypothetical protein
MSEENYKEGKLRSKSKSNLNEGCKEVCKIVNARDKREEEDPNERTARVVNVCQKAKRQAKEGNDEATFGFIKEYERSFRVFVENQDHIRKIFEKRKGEKIIELSLYFLRIEHSCFHTDLDDNAVVKQAEKSLSGGVSYVDLSIGLYDEWKKLKGKLSGLRDTQDAYLREFYYDDLFKSLKKHKEQLDCMEGVEPLYFSELKFDTPPHLNIRIAWKLKGASSGMYYTDILKKEEGELFLPIIVEENKTECLPILVPVSEEDAKKFSIDQIMAKLDKRLGDRGGDVKVGFEGKLTIPLSAFPTHLPSKSFIDFVQNGMDNKLPISFIKSITKDVVRNVETTIAAGVEHHSGSGEINEIGETIKKRVDAWLTSDLLKMEPLNGERVPISEGLPEKYADEFLAFKKRVLQ